MVLNKPPFVHRIFPFRCVHHAPSDADDVLADSATDISTAMIDYGAVDNVPDGSRDTRQERSHFD